MTHPKKRRKKGSIKFKFHSSVYPFFMENPKPFIDIFLVHFHTYLNLFYSFLTMILFIFLNLTCNFLYFGVIMKITLQSH
jgi:hypothetical protein